VKRAVLILLAALALLVPGSARANGDPASDVLLTGQTFLPFEAPISDSAKNDLNKTVAEANAKGYPIRVAIIAFTGDLGTAGSLWAKPQPYAKFLWNELSFQYDKRLLVAMPAGFGVYNGNGKPVDKEQAVLKGVKPGQIPTDLTESAAEAVRRLAAANGITVKKPSSGGSSTRDRILILVGALVVLALVLVFPTRWVKRRGQDGARSPSSEPR
jgi:hypothetical protein